MSPDSSTDARPHLLLIASTGGHLAQLLVLEPWWSRYERTWVTFDKPDARSALAGEDVVYAHHPTTRNARNALRNLVLAVAVLDRTAPSLVVSTGAGVAAPFFLVARLRGIPAVYVEVFDRISSRTLTGRMTRWMSDAFCVQWDEQRPLYPGSENIGVLL